ncbi:hypothetical protein Tco_1141933 [Tanacetum coccineum]
MLSHHHLKGNELSKLYPMMKGNMSITSSVISSTFCYFKWSYSLRYSPRGRRSPPSRSISPPPRRGRSISRPPSYRRSRRNSPYGNGSLYNSSLNDFLLVASELLCLEYGYCCLVFLAEVKVREPKYKRLEHEMEANGVAAKSYPLCMNVVVMSNCEQSGVGSGTELSVAVFL